MRARQTIFILALFAMSCSRFPLNWLNDANSQNSQAKGIWISNATIAGLPASGSAWNSIQSIANGSLGSPDVSDQDDATNVRVMAAALYYAKTGNESVRTKVRAACMAAIGTESGGRTLALGRELAAYVIAADLVGLTASEDATFKSWLRACLTKTLDGKTLQSTHEERPNNWGTHAGASRAAVAMYLGDQAELDRTAQVFRGWLGDRSSYDDFSYGDLSWQANPSQPVGINPKGATKSGHSIDGVLPDDMRRGGGFKFPPASTGYPWEGLQGALAQAVILYNAGFSEVWNWEDKALLRSVEFLYDIGWKAEGDDAFQPWIVNAVYGTSFPTNSAGSGKNVGWTDWTHASGIGDPGGGGGDDDETPPAPSGVTARVE